MRHSYRAALVCLVTFACLMTWGCGQAADLRIGTGYAKPEATVAADGDAAALRAAIAEAKANLGGGKPGFVLFCQNHLAPGAAAQKLLPVLKEDLADVPYLGVGLSGEHYAPMTGSGKGAGGFSVAAFCEDFVAKVIVLDAAEPQQGWLYQSGKEARAHQMAYARSLNNIGAKLGDAVAASSDANSLVLIEGALHQPANYYLMQGAKRRLGEFAHVMGGASADGGYLIHDGEVLQRKVAAIVLSGPFDVVEVGMEGLPGDLAGSYDRLLATAAESLHGAKPIGAILYGCASWQCKADELERGLGTHLPGLTVYGHNCGGEMGRRWLDDTLIARTDLGMVSLIVPKGAAAEAGRKAPVYPAKMMKFTGEVSSEDPATGKSGYITDWLLAGPYPYSLADAAQPDAQDLLDKPFVDDEAALAGSPGAEVTGGKWTVYATDVPEARCEVINLDMAYGYPEFAVAYMSTKVICDAPVWARLYCGSDDYIAVWVNGEQVVHYNDAPRGAKWDQQQADIELDKGENVITVKVVDLINGWAGIIRLTDRQGRPLKLQAVPWE